MARRGGNKQMRGRSKANPKSGASGAKELPLPTLGYGKPKKKGK